MPLLSEIFRIASPTAVTDAQGAIGREVRIAMDQQAAVAAVARAVARPMSEMVGAAVREPTSVTVPRDGV